MINNAIFTAPRNGHPEDIIDIPLTAPTAMAFDSENNPYCLESTDPRNFGFVQAMFDGRWVRLSYLDALREIYPDITGPTEVNAHEPGTIAFDDQDGMYVVIKAYRNSVGRQMFLLFSPDLGASWQVFLLPGGNASVEQYTGHNDICRPPAIVARVYTAPYDGKHADYYDLMVFLPERDQGVLVLGDPIHITGRSYGGGSIVTTGTLSHIVYGEIPLDDVKESHIYASTINRNTRAVTEREFLCRAESAAASPDGHCSPAITADAKGHLHVLSGAHNRSFKYLRSTKRNSIAQWSTPQDQNGEAWFDYHGRQMGSHGQTYARLVCCEDMLFSVYRVHPYLVGQAKFPEDVVWGEQDVLVNPPDHLVPSDNLTWWYTHWYARLFIDRDGYLYVSFTFYETTTGSEGDYPRVLIKSIDAGETWEIADMDGEDL